MAVLMLTLFVVLGTALVVGFELTPTWLGVAGRNPAAGTWMWRPHHPVNFGGGESLAVKVSLAGPECTEGTDTLEVLGDETGGVNALDIACPVGVLFSGDGGITFELTRGLSRHYCGGLGVVRGNKLYCPGRRVDEMPEDLPKRIKAQHKEEDAAAKKKGRAPAARPQRKTPVIAYEEYEYEVLAIRETDAQKAKRREAYLAGENTNTANGALSERKTGNYVTFDQSVYKSPIKHLRLGGGVLHIPERSFHIRNVEVTLDNATVVHAAYKSTDGGSHWDFVSVIPIRFARHTHIMRMSDTRLLLVGGEIDDMNQTSSLFLGNKWEKVEKAPFVMPATSHVSRYFTTVASGVVPRPTIGIVGLGTKKNSQKSIQISQVHNDISKMAASQDSPDLVNYTDAFNHAKEFDCLGSGAQNSEEAGCASSGFIAIIAADANGTVVALYDQLRDGSGFRPALRRGQHVVYGMRIKINDTAEKEEYDARVDSEAKRKEAEKAAEQLAQKARDELSKKRAQEQADAKKRNKARRQQWLKDDEKYKAQARELEAVDGQYIVIRPVDDDTVDLEKEMF
jgi:hypothetical protein